MSTSKTNRHIRRAAIAALAIFPMVTAVPALAQDHSHMNHMDMKGPKPAATTPGYSFQLAGPAQAAGGGKNIVAIRLTRDGKPVSGAIVIRSRLDMGPMGMASMTAPIKPLGEKPPGTYRFEVTNGPVWKTPDNWALSFDAKVQGVAQTISGSVTVKLNP